LREFIDWAAHIGFRLVQLLPINETGGDHSPYNAISAMAIEPTTLYLAPGSPEELTHYHYEAVLADSDLGKLRQGNVNHAAVKYLKRLLLEKAFANFARYCPKERQSRFRNFCARESDWLDDYATFRALMEENDDNEEWDSWPVEHRDLASAGAWLARQSSIRQKRFSQRENFFRYVQWIAYEQWSETKSYAEQRGVALMGDIPFGVSYCSADVFARPDEFILDWCGGAPPESHFKDDQFTQKWGQNWGIPLFDWKVMRKRRLNWWRQRVRSIRQSFHLFRIDHVLGFYRIYAFPWRPHHNKKFLPLEWDQMQKQTGGRGPQFIPRNDETSDNRDTNQREGEEYLRAVLEESGDARLIGEDLGTVPVYVRPSLQSLGIAGFKIPQWEVYHGRVTPGTEYERLSVATYATHDHKPLRAMWEEAFEHSSLTSDQSRAELEKIATFAGFNRRDEPVEFERDFYPVAMEALFRCESWIATVMITDLLARSYRFNVPGTAASSNWSHRMRRPVSRLRSSPKEQKRMELIHELLEKTDRI
jgi:4-alpha-glucanotransferase